MVGTVYRAARSGSRAGHGPYTDPAPGCSHRRRTRTRAPRVRLTDMNSPREGPEMPFYFFFGLLGLVIGGLVTWFFIADHPFESTETPGGPVDPVEASLLAKEMTADGMPLDEATIVKLLGLHGAYVDGKIREAQAAAEARRLEVERTQSIASETNETGEQAG
jgi:hypothetical protein